MIVVIVGPLAASVIVASVLCGVPPGPRAEAVPLGQLPARPALPLVLHEDGRVVGAGVASVEAVGPRAPVGGLGVGEGGGHGAEGEGIAGRLRGRLVGEVEVGARAGAEAVTREAAASVDNITVGAVPVQLSSVSSLVSSLPSLALLPDWRGELDAVPALVDAAPAPALHGARVRARARALVRERLASRVTEAHVSNLPGH